MFSKEQSYQLIIPATITITFSGPNPTSCTEVKCKGHSEFKWTIRANLQTYPLFQYILKEDSASV